MELLHATVETVSTKNGVISQTSQNQTADPISKGRPTRSGSAPGSPKKHHTLRHVRSKRGRSDANGFSSGGIQRAHDVGKDAKATPVVRSTKTKRVTQRVYAAQQSANATGIDSSPDPLTQDPWGSVSSDTDESPMKSKFNHPPLPSHLKSLRSGKRAGAAKTANEQQIKDSSLKPPRPDLIIATSNEDQLFTSQRRREKREDDYNEAIEELRAQLQLKADLAEYVAVDEKRIAKERAEAEEKRRQEEIERERRAGRKAPSRPVISPLSAEWTKKLAQAMEQPYGRQLATAPDGTGITRKDFGTLYPQPRSQDNSSGWLNDEIINTYMRHIVEFGHDRIGHKRNETPKFHNFVSQFYQNLSSKGPDSVARWAKRAKIAGEKLNEVEMVFIPCNPGVHWTMLIVHPKRKLVEYFDSFHGDGARFLDLAEAWLNLELPGFDPDEWKFRDGVGPTQQNSSDCGVFAITTAKMVMLGIDPEKAYTERDLPQQRKRIACELMNGGFTGDFAPLEDDIFNEALHKSTTVSQPETNGGEARL